MTYTLKTTDEPLPPEAQIVDEGLGRFNQQAADLAAVRQFACIARLDTSRVIGGAVARWWGACCELQQLWVDDEHRYCGVGRQLVREVETHACERGCSVLYLETFSFQSPEFYRKLGYEVACEFQGFPDGISKYIMQKTLL